MPTVQGDGLRPGAGARVDAHAHAWIDPPPGVAEADAIALRDEAARASALRAFALAAGERRAALVDCQPPGAGRDARALARLAEASGVAICASTGFHLARYYPEGVRPWRDADAALAAFTDELRGGLQELPGRPAAVIKAADTGRAQTGRDGPDAPWWTAALAARAATDALLLIHTERGSDAEGLLAWLEARGVPPDRVYLCHVDKRPDAGLHAELAGAGALLGYDTFLRPSYDPDRNAWPLLRTMLESGLGRHVALGLDLASPAMWPTPAGSDDPARPSGPAALLTAVAPRVRALGASERDMDDLLGDNLLRRAARVGRSAAHHEPPVVGHEEPT